MGGRRQSSIPLCLAARDLRAPARMPLFRTGDRVQSMADWTLMTLQLRGKTRRFVQSTLVRQDTEALLAQRQRRVQPLRRLLQDPLPLPVPRHRRRGAVHLPHLREALRAVPALPAAHRGPAGARGPVQLHVRAGAVAVARAAAARAGARVARAASTAAREHAQHRDRRRPVGRRGQGEDRRPAHLARAGRGPLQRRPQRRPHRHRRPGRSSSSTSCRPGSSTPASSA